MVARYESNYSPNLLTLNDQTIEKPKMIFEKGLSKYKSIAIETVDSPDTSAHLAQQKQAKTAISDYQRIKPRKVKVNLTEAP